jgi:hypothetical protein
VRIPDDQNVGSMSAMELLELYWKASHTKSGDIEALNQLAAEVIAEIETRDES